MGEAWGWVAVLAVVLAIWGATDVRKRGEIDANRPRKHKTDFTVYTEAGAAFFDGRDPYHVTNPRGWYYMYPPMFAIFLAPIAHLPETTQVVIWFAVSCLFGWGAYRECRRIVNIAFAPAAERSCSVSTRTQTWIAVAAVTALFFPVMNCLQRGQVGLAVIYPLLLGARLVFENTSLRRTMLGGFLLAAPVVLKLTPLLPAGFVLLLLAAGWWLDRSRESWNRAFGASAGFAAGMATLLFFVPGLLVGWNQNLAHLENWAARVVMDSTPGQELSFNPRSKRNQSLDNSVNRLGNWIAHAFNGGPPDQVLDTLYGSYTSQMPMDTRFVALCLKATKAALLVLLLTAGWFAVRSNDLAAQVTCFGLACALTLFISPISWGHHYVSLLPAAVMAPFYFAVRNRPTKMFLHAFVPAALVVVHYALLPWAGRAGVLGIGGAAWVAIASVGVLRESRAQGIARTRDDFHLRDVFMRPARAA